MVFSPRFADGPLELDLLRAVSPLAGNLDNRAAAAAGLLAGFIFGNGGSSTWLNHTHRVVLP